MEGNRFTFANDPVYDDVLVSVENMVMTDADGNAVLVNPKTPLTSLPEPAQRACIAALLAMVALVETEGVVKVSYTAEDKAAVAAVEEAAAAEAAAAAAAAEEGAGEGTGEGTTDTPAGTCPEGDNADAGAVAEGDTSGSDAVSVPPVTEPTEGTIAPSKDELMAALDAIGAKYDKRMGVERLAAILAEAEAAAATE